MSKRILELAKEAGFTVIEDRIHFDEGNNIAASCPEAHKFAELLIRECVSVAWQTFLNDHSVVPTLNTHAVLQHFNLTEKNNGNI